MIEKQITVYETKDGKQFKDKEEAISYENFLELSIENIKNEINIFLSNLDNYADWIRKDDFTEEDTHFCNGVQKNNNKIYLTIVENKENSVELDENFLIDYDKWDEFKDSLVKKYNVEFKVPIWYWSK